MTVLLEPEDVDFCERISVDLYPTGGSNRQLIDTSSIFTMKYDEEVAYGRGNKISEF